MQNSSNVSKTDKFDLSITVGNNCIMLDGGIPANIKNIVKIANTTNLLCAKFDFVSEAFTYPLQSSKFGICIVDSECSDLFAVSLFDVKSKCICWPLDDSERVVVIPFLH